MPIKRAFATFVFLVMCCGTSFAETIPSRSLATSFNKLETPWKVPDLLLREGNGRDRTLHDLLANELKGHFVLLTIWATWCSTCLLEMPSLDNLQGFMKSKNFTVIALSQDREGATLVPAYYRRHGLTNLKVFIDPDGRAIRRLRLRGIPANILIAPDGNEIGRVQRRIEWARSDNVVALESIMSAH